MVAEHFLTYKKAKIPSSKSDFDGDEFWGLGASFLGSFLLLFSTFLSKKHLKNLDLPFFYTSIGSDLALIFISLVPVPWIWGLGV